MVAINPRCCWGHWTWSDGVRRLIFSPSSLVVFFSMRICQRELKGSLGRLWHKQFSFNRSAEAVTGEPSRSYDYTPYAGTCTDLTQLNRKGGRWIWFTRSFLSILAVTRVVHTDYHPFFHESGEKCKERCSTTRGKH